MAHNEGEFYDLLSDLFDAVLWVESPTEHGVHPHAVNRETDAVGIVQITKIVIDDVNRILGREEFSLEDRFSVTRSWRIFVIYLTHYGRYWERTHNGESVPVDYLARMWNGGPYGWECRVTEPYWRKVKKALEANHALRNPAALADPDRRVRHDRHGVHGR